jgi:hypothetical protein
MGSVAKIPELAFLAFHNRSFMPFSAHHFCQETIFATEPLFRHSWIYTLETRFFSTLALNSCTFSTLTLKNSTRAVV